MSDILDDLKMMADHLDRENDDEPCDLGMLLVRAIGEIRKLRTQQPVSEVPMPTDDNLLCYQQGYAAGGKDAERYRFLRGDGGPASVRWPRWEVTHWTGNWNPVSGKELDAAIDAALRGEVKP